MYGSEVRLKALAFMEAGYSLRAISAAMRVSRSTLRDWRDHPEKALASRATCPRCSDTPTLPEPSADYTYLLGLYLGDGCISVAGDPAKGVWKLRIMCSDAWPGLIHECARAMRAVRPDNKVSMQHKQGCVEVMCHSRHWPCLFPQHGSGMKHTRRIELQPWQRSIAAEFPGDLARGLFHSDGYRGVNRVRRRLATGERWYEYSRYLFVNRSEDILRLCGQALDELGVAWRFSKPGTISVARREAVARLDEFVGPKC